MKRIINNIVLCALAFASLSSETNAKEVSTKSLLKEMTDRAAMTSMPAYKAAQVSSYDRRSKSSDEPGWFANNDGGGYVRLETTEGRQEKVLFDEKGPGAIVRFWLTTSDKRGILRFYFDGESVPGIKIDAFDLARFPVDCGKALNLTHTHYVNEIDKTGGNTFFLPLPYQKSCKVTLEEPDNKVSPPRYYQIGFRTYPDGTKTRSFSLADARKNSALITKVNETLSHPKPGEGMATSSRLTFPSDNADISLPKGNKAITNLSIKIDCPKEYLQEISENVWIVLSFDGTECVREPVDCFFGAGFGAKRETNWNMDSDGNGSFSCRWLMPYASDASLKLEYKGSKAFNVQVDINTINFRRDENTLYFHSSYKQEDGVKTQSDYDSQNNLDWNFAKASGPGIWCGDILTLYNHCPDWYGEGDEKIWLDDDSFPSFFGTGTEDFFNCSWAPVVPFSTPFGGAPRADSTTSTGYNTFLRIRCLDVIPFERSFVFNLEMLSWHPGTVDLRSGGWWYGRL
jgi:hypothetical protein